MTTADKRNSETSSPIRTYKVEDIAAMLNIGRTSAYNLVKEGHFKTVRIGNAIRISKKSFDEWLDTPSPNFPCPGQRHLPDRPNRHNSTKSPVLR